MRLWLLISALLSCLVGTPARSDAQAPQPEATAFVHVNVLPMDRERVLRDQTVLVEDGRISAIAPTVAIPDGARIIDGRGNAFLSPGLSDMHSHSDTRGDLAVYLANGVTTILNMGEARNSFVGRTRAAANAGEIPGPYVFAALAVDGTPQFGHLVVATPEEARAVVSLARTNGYSFIKVYNNLAPEVFEALAPTARAGGVPIVGHGVTRVGLERQLAAGQVLVAHAEEFFYTYFTRPGAEQGFDAPALDRIPAAIALLRRHRAFVTADLATYATIAGQFGRPEVVSAYLRMPEARYLSPADRLEWAGSGYQRRQVDLSARMAFLGQFVHAMNDAGIPLVAGTDAPSIPGLVPGFSLHQDLHALEEAGLTRFQALSTATRIPGEFIRQALPDAVPFGTVTRGARADLILSADNPLDDLATLRHPLGVLRQGRWYDADALQALLANTAERYRTATTN